MLSDVEVGAFLSGGVDSGYLASSSGADQAFTVGFDEGDRYSEVNKAAKVAEKAGKAAQTVWTVYDELNKAYGM